MGTRPLGQYAPTERTGTWRWPRNTPGRVSASKSVSVARWSSAKLRIWAWAKAMLSFSASGSDAVAAAICPDVTSKLGGSQSSSSRE
jgi:hypothetical protein